MKKIKKRGLQRWKLGGTVKGQRVDKKGDMIEDGKEGREGGGLKRKRERKREVRKQ